MDERVLAALAKAELEAATLMDDLNDIASAADHEELARFGGREGGCEGARADRGERRGSIEEPTRKVTGSNPAVAAAAVHSSVAASPATPRRTTPGRDKADFLASAPRVAIDASSILADRADIERRTMEALERERRGRRTRHRQTIGGAGTCEGGPEARGGSGPRVRRAATRGGTKVL